MANEDINGAINYLKVYRKMDEKLHNMSPKDSVSYFATNECLKYWDMAIKALEQTGHCKECKWWKDSDGVFRRGIGAESQCPINRKEVYEGNGYCYMFEPQERKEEE